MPAEPVPMMATVRGIVEMWAGIGMLLLLLHPLFLKRPASGTDRMETDRKPHETRLGWGGCSFAPTELKGRDLQSSCHR